jgi:hypothetical protein
MIIPKKLHPPEEIRNHAENGIPPDIMIADRQKRRREKMIPNAMLISERRDEVPFFILAARQRTYIAATAHKTPIAQ